MSSTQRTEKFYGASSSILSLLTRPTTTITVSLNYTIRNNLFSERPGICISWVEKCILDYTQIACLLPQYFFIFFLNFKRVTGSEEQLWKGLGTAFLKPQKIQHPTLFLLRVIFFWLPYSFTTIHFMRHLTVV